MIELNLLFIEITSFWNPKSLSMDFLNFYFVIHLTTVNRFGNKSHPAVGQYIQLEWTFQNLDCHSRESTPFTTLSQNTSFSWLCWMEVDKQFHYWGMVTTVNNMGCVYYFSQGDSSSSALLTLFCQHPATSAWVFTKGAWASWGNSCLGMFCWVGRRILRILF